MCSSDLQPASPVVTRRGRREMRVAPEPFWTGAMQRSTVFACIAVALSAAFSPVGALAVGTSNWHLAGEVPHLGVQKMTRPTSGRAHLPRVLGATPVGIDRK